MKWFGHPVNQPISSFEKSVNEFQFRRSPESRPAEDSTMQCGGFLASPFVALLQRLIVSTHGLDRRWMSTERSSCCLPVTEPLQTATSAGAPKFRTRFLHLGESSLHRADSQCACNSAGRCSSGCPSARYSPRSQSQALSSHQSRSGNYHPHSS